MVSQVVYQDVIGEDKRPPGPPLDSIGLDKSVETAFAEWLGETFRLSPPQSWAIENLLLDTKAHYLVCAATNSGKTLIAYLRMLHRATVQGRRFVYVVPLKALAEEKAGELEELCTLIAKHGGPKYKIAKSTGDYQLTADFLGSAPPSTGEIVVCTPERLEVIARNPNNLAWLRAIDTFVLDEFHLLGEKRRGATMECLVTRALTICPDASILALSATIGNPPDLAEWLAHTGKEVKLLRSDFRYPKLSRVIVTVEDKDAYLSREVERILQDNHTSILIFVYRKADAERLAQELAAETDRGSEVAYFHSGLSIAQRAELGTKFKQSHLRVLVTTTSLKMGVNTPATHVFVRDTIFMGSGRLLASDIEQMLGRAGRGDIPGSGVVICSSEESSESFEDAFINRKTNDLEPQLAPPTATRPHAKRGQDDSEIDSVLGAVLAEIARHEFISIKHVEEFFSHTWSVWSRPDERPDYARQTGQLERDKLIYKVENSESTYSPTKLGKTVAHCGLSAESGAMLAGFLRALIRLAQKDEERDGRRHDYLRRLTDLDLLFLTVASFEGRQYVPGRISAKRRGEIEAQIEALDPDKKPIVNLWRSSDSESYPTRRLLSSLRFPKEIIEKNDESLFYRIMLPAMLLYRHAQGDGLETLASEYGLRIGDIEGGLKFTSTWLLNCLAQICSPDRCYNLNFIAMRCFELTEDLSFGATLGKLLSVKGIGRRTVQKLVDNDIKSLSGLSSASVDILIEFGIAKSQAQKVLQYARRASR